MLLSEKDKNITKYISGSILRRMSKKIETLGLCQQCFQACYRNYDSSESCNSFKYFKEYTKGCLFRVSPFLKKVAKNLKLFEGIKQ